MSTPRLPVAVLGATGTVGQKFIRLLEAHPWFEVAAVAASERSAGRPYGEVVRWREPTPLAGAHRADGDRTLQPSAAGRDRVFGGGGRSRAGD